MHDRLLFAKVAAAQGDTHRVAAGGPRRRMHRLTERQAPSQSLEIRSALALHGRRLADFDVNDALASGSAARVFDAVERWRAVSHRLPLLSAPEDERSAALVAELRQARREARRRRRARAPGIAPAPPSSSGRSAGWTGRAPSRTAARAAVAPVGHADRPRAARVPRRAGPGVGRPGRRGVRPGRHRPGHPAAPRRDRPPRSRRWRTGSRATCAPTRSPAPTRPWRRPSGAPWRARWRRSTSGCSPTCELADGPRRGGPGPDPDGGAVGHAAQPVRASGHRRPLGDPLGHARCSPRETSRRSAPGHRRSPGRGSAAPRPRRQPWPGSGSGSARWRPSTRRRRRRRVARRAGRRRRGPRGGARHPRAPEPVVLVVAHGRRPGLRARAAAAVDGAARGAVGLRRRPARPAPRRRAARTHRRADGAGRAQRRRAGRTGVRRRGSRRDGRPTTGTWPAAAPRRRPWPRRWPSTRAPARSASTAPTGARTRLRSRGPGP